jgi:riboflavin kinase/FMN adenylyltransferase
MKEILTQTKRPIALALGFFDSLHIVHRKIITDAVNFARANDCQSAVFTFMDNGISRFKGDMIYLYDERKKLIEDVGVDYVIPFVFNNECMKTSKEEFLNKLSSLVDLKAIFCGYDFTFGYMGEGNVEYLAKYCNERGIKLFVTQKESAFNDKISSSMIKNFLIAGEIEKANELLVVPYSITSKVVKGRGVGHLFGVPTANLLLEKNKLLIKEGVYGTFTKIGDKKYVSVTNVGKKPTFDDMTVSIETLIKDFDGDIYGETVTVFFEKYIRDIEKFDSKEHLREQITKDLNWEKRL